MARIRPALFGFSILTLAGAIATLGTQTAGMIAPSDQMRVLATLFNALAPMLSPLSSAAGTKVLMPIGGEELALGIAPLIAWVAAGVAIGLMSRDGSEAATASLALASLTYILWLGLALLVLPSTGAAIPWSNYLDMVVSRILVSTPLDFFSIYIIPTALSAATTSLYQKATRPRIHEKPIERRRIWDY
ncbi:MAG: hypothetical protein NXY59_03070 [Aigarchaeota archaeon]|nr:hypothetical protein [Candidatus Pelearchaeum maunauluense]